MPKTKLNKTKPQSQEVRPIGARALKSAIDTLRPRLFEASVLDLFAGQGRFGIAASEEGISSVTFVEKDRKTAAELKLAISAPRFPKEPNAKVVCQDAAIFLEQTQEKFDIVFADPPFPLWSETFEKSLLSAVTRVLKAGSIFLVKHPSRMLPCSEFSRLTLNKESEFGESRLLYFSYETE
jgi:16S rRNA (guanine966-N2)-methyltransferase